MPKEGAAPQFALRKRGSRSLNFGAKSTDEMYYLYKKRLMDFLGVFSNSVGRNSMAATFS